MSRSNFSVLKIPFQSSACEILRKPVKSQKAKRPPPLSVRLSPDQRKQLERDAVGMSLNAYVLSRLFDDERPKHKRARQPGKRDKAIARALRRLSHAGLGFWPVPPLLLEFDYNITVDYSETFFVRAGDALQGDAVWVHNCPKMKIMSLRKLPLGRQIAINRTLAHINNNTKPVVDIRRKWGRKFENNPREGELKPDLPEKSSSGKKISYVEYRVTPRKGQTGGGTDRIVVGSDGSRYYSGSHYGDTGGTPFVQIKW